MSFLHKPCQAAGATSPVRLEFVSDPDLFTDTEHFSDPGEYETAVEAAWQELNFTFRGIVYRVLQSEGVATVIPDEFLEAAGRELARLAVQGSQEGLAWYREKKTGVHYGDE